MGRRIAAIILIFAATTLAWMVLGATIFSRTYDIGSSSGRKVASSWGTAQTQAAPTASYDTVRTRKEVVNEDGKQVTRVVPITETTNLPLESSKIDVGFEVEHRQKGLLWYTLYKVNFDGAYTYTNNTAREQRV